ncbi:MAG: hypothetical protein INR66_27205 [Gordonia polyisoprenivorans]|nr:hypothetical protein [Gordonia polyisoprenivorans]
MSTSQRRAAQDHDWITLLGVVLNGVPKLDGARCVAHPHLFVERHDDESARTAHQRHDSARAICDSCPCQRPCAEWVASCTPSQRPSGVLPVLDDVDKAAC